MQRERVPVHEPQPEKPSDVDRRNSERVPMPTSEVTRGSHVTPVAPALEPTDPFASAGPSTLPPSWFPAADDESADVAAAVFELEGGSEFSSQAPESSDDVTTPRPRDTVPSPPPCLEDYEDNDLSCSEDRPKTP